MDPRLLIAVACVLSGCAGGSDSDANTNAAPDTARIEQLSTPKNLVVEKESPTELLPLSPEVLSRAGFGAAPCAFVVEGRLLIAASREGALARFRGGLRRLAPSGPVEARGAYFEDEGTSLSIGRDANETGPARARISDRREGEQRDIAGEWTCRIPE